jgi:hypothetical protein
MLVLCGSSISNYYNKVKLALLEKGVAFSEEYVATGGSDEAVLGASPLAKIPFLRTDAGRSARARRSSSTSRRRPRAAAPAARSVRRGQGARAGDLRRPAPRAGGARPLSEGVLRRQPERRQRGADPRPVLEEHRRLQAPGRFAP